MQGYRIFEHTADVGVKAYGTDLKQAYANAAKGLFSLITDLRSIRTKTSRDIEVTAADRETLLVAWLNELNYLFDVDHIALKKFEITLLNNTRLRARVYGEKIDSTRHHIKIGVKATTYHMLRVTHNNGYQVRVLFDI